MKRQNPPWIYLLTAVVGLLVTIFAMERWAPDRYAQMADRDRARAQALSDAQRLGVEFDSEPVFSVSNWANSATRGAFDGVLRQIEDPATRERLLRRVPPIRLAVTFGNARTSRGGEGIFVVEYNAELQLVGALFGETSFEAFASEPQDLRQEADQIASVFLGAEPPEPEPSRMGGAQLLKYRAGPGEPDLLLLHSGPWRALLMPDLPDGDAESEAIVPFLARIGGLTLLCVAALGLLIWRLVRRRAGWGLAAWLALAAFISLLPIIWSARLMPLNAAILGVVTVVIGAGILTLWMVAEAELREGWPSAAEHVDRLVNRAPVKATGGALLAGLAVGSLMAAFFAASGALLEPFGGHYRTHVALLPTGLVSSVILQGIAVTALTAFPIGLGARLFGKAGAVLGILVAGIAWYPILPVGPPWIAFVSSFSLAFVSGTFLLRRGLLALLTAVITALSLPTLWVFAKALPVMIGTFAVVAGAPLLVAGAGLWLVWAAPRSGRRAGATASYIAQQEREEYLAGEVELLRKLQLSLLPPVERSSMVGGDISWRMIPADTVGGDLIDLIEDDEGRLWLAVADVAGHGLSCSVLTAYAKAAVTEHASAGASPAEALTRVRKLFGRLESQTRAIVTLLLAVWEPSTRELKVASAGHPPLLVWDGEQTFELGPSGPPLGARLEVGRELEVTRILPAAATLVGYTDGVVEAAGPRAELFGYQRWPRMLPELAGLSAQEVLSHLLAAVETHRAGIPAADDVTAVVLQLPAPGTS